MACKYGFGLTALVVLVGALALGLAGCAAQQGAGSSAAGQQVSEGMTCAKCETVWVREMTAAGPKVTVLRSKADMVCPDCDAMAESQLTGDGKVMLHECPTCKVTPQKVTPGTLSLPKGPHS